LPVRKSNVLESRVEVGQIDDFHGHVHRVGARHARRNLKREAVQTRLTTAGNGLAKPSARSVQVRRVKVGREGEWLKSQRNEHGRRSKAVVLHEVVKGAETCHVRNRVDNGRVCTASCVRKRTLCGIGVARTKKRARRARRETSEHDGIASVCSDGHACQKVDLLGAGNNRSFKGQ
jgi:hypothetical protein